ncbi:hypothetical protein AYO20_11550 [Fonsecaea nubica]|uniref:Uncharacterized protein n=1 Tax=Fonsecaea nubica TaxID=856822 RepID=A0A178BTU8_9EURO|nr:hypothetical protein AYO20_11550 [Fonsecaea nubica]OAL20113.1 hypothetical protein AYO20_11550 [Fonsecaea nubica]
MAPVTEVAFLPLRPGVDINDTSTSEGKVMANMVEVGKHAPGVQKNYWGIEEENSAHVHLMLDWDSLEAHKAYQARPEYPEFLAAARSMVNPESTSEAFHVSFTPHPPTPALQAPVTEILRAYYPVDQVSTEGVAFEADLLRLLDALRAHGVPGFSGEISSGWSLEEVDYESTPSKVFVAYIGWDSVQAHVDATKSEIYQANRLNRLPKAIKVAHVKVKSP